MLTKEQLINIGAENLADIILYFYKKGPNIQNQLDTIVAGFETEPEKIVAIIKTDMTCLYDDFNRYDADVVVNLVEQICDNIMTDLLPKSPNQSVELLLSLLDSYEDILGQVDDSGGEVGGAFQQACAHLSTAYKHATYSKEDVVNVVYDRFMDDRYGIYMDIISDFKDVLGDEGVELLKQKFKQSFNQKNREAINGLKTLADCQENVDDYIEACSFATGEVSENDKLIIAKKLIKHLRGKEAIEWLDSIECSETSYFQKNKITLRIDALDVCGDYEEAQAEREKMFGIDLSAEVYNETLRHCKEGFSESWKNTAIQKAFEFRDSHVALEFLIQIKEFVPAAKFVYQKIDTLNGKNYYRLRHIADALCENHPLAATLLYRKMIEPHLLAPEPKYNYWAAKDLNACENLSSKITDWKGYKNHQLYCEEISVQHKRESIFLAENTSVFSKRKTKRARLGRK